MAASESWTQAAQLDDRQTLRGDFLLDLRSRFSGPGALNRFFISVGKFQGESDLATYLKGKVVSELAAALQGL